MKLSQITHIAIIAVFAVVMSGVANAANTCYSGGANGISLDPSTNGTNHTYNATDMAWTANFDYGDLSGIAVCNGTSASLGTVSQTDFETGTTGVNCWCRMLSPARSAWVGYAPTSSATVCATECARYCAYSCCNYNTFRVPMLGSVTN